MQCIYYYPMMCVCLLPVPTLHYIHPFVILKLPVNKMKIFFCIRQKKDAGVQKCNDKTGMYIAVCMFVCF